MSRPKLVLFDEPSLGLAPNLVERTFEIIKEIRAQGVTVVMVEQNAFAALELSDRSYVLEQGRVALSGTGAELLDNPHVKSAYLGAVSCPTLRPRSKRMRTRIWHGRLHNRRQP